jgi:hypothetical protein
MVFQALNDTNMLLANALCCWPLWCPWLYCKLIPFRPPPHPALDPLHFQSTTSQCAYDNIISAAAPVSYSTHADQYFGHASHLTSHLFGCIYHSWYPTNWIRQILGTNFNLTFVQPTPIPKHPQRLHTPHLPTATQALSQYHWTFWFDPTCCLTEISGYQD